MVDIAYESGGDRLSGPHLLVLPRIAEERHDGGDAARRGSVEGVDGYQLLHDVVVDRLAVALHYIAIRPADTLSRPHIDLAVGEMGALELTQGNTKDLGDLLGQGDVRPSGEEHHSVAGDNVQLSPRFSWRSVSLRDA